MKPAHRTRTIRAAVICSLLLLGMSQGAQGTPRNLSPQPQAHTGSPSIASPAAKPPGWLSRTWTRIRPGTAAGQGQRNGETQHRLTFREAMRQAKKEFQVYRGKKLERLSDWLAVGRSTYNRQLSVGENLKQVALDKKIPHYYAEVNGKQVLHLVVELGQGKTSKKALRQIYQRIGKQTIELNYKASTPKNRYGHVAMRLGMGATYDLTGSRGVSNLPKSIATILHAITGKKELTVARKRNLRRFMESRRDAPDSGGELFYGLLFSAKAEDIGSTAQLYEQRLKNITEFSVGGGDGSKGVYSCAQFLTEDVPFLNTRGVNRSVSAKAITSAAKGTNELEAVLVYKTSSVPEEKLANYP